MGLYRSVFTRSTSIDKFSADELMNQGGLPAYYYGYDYLGNPVTGGRVSFDEFINETVTMENMRRISLRTNIYCWILRISFSLMILGLM